jgi:predicted NUDIX family NTP pyrophosphohydrolase
VIDEVFSYDDHYTFTVGLTNIEKVVTYYIGRVKDGEPKVQTKEVKGYAWLTLPEARLQLTNEHARPIIDAIAAHLPNSRLFF